MPDEKAFDPRLTARRREAVVYTLSGILGKEESSIQALIKQNMFQVCKNAFDSNTLVLSEDTIGYRAEEATWTQLMLQAGKSIEEFPFIQRKPPSDLAEGITSKNVLAFVYTLLERRLGEMKKEINRQKQQLTEECPEMREYLKLVVSKEGEDSHFKREEI